MLSTTKESLISSATSLIRKKGYSSFSYADLEKIVGIKKASIYHHFKSKEDLGVILIKTCIENTKKKQKELDENYKNINERLKSYSDLLTNRLLEDGLPMCTSLAAEISILPPSLNNLAREYFNIHLRWIESAIKEGISTGELNNSFDTMECAVNFLSVIQGISIINATREEQTPVSSHLIATIINTKNV